MAFLGILIEICEFICLVVLMLYDYFCSFYKIFVPTTLKCLRNEIILVTGAGSGIGREVCKLLVKSGAKTLVIWDFNKVENEKLALELLSMGAKAYPYEVDITDRQNVAQIAAKVRKDVGDVTILHNNAGITQISDMLEQDPDQLERTIQVNLISHFWTLKEFLPKMIEMRQGHIVTTCSTLGFKGVMKGVAYSASKYGVRGFIEALKSEIRHHPRKPDIKFTTIYPFFVNTPLINGLCVTYRLSFLFQHLTPQFVAEKIVEGIRKNAESVHIPWYLPFLLFLENLGPVKAAERVMDFFIKDIKCDSSKAIASKVESDSKHFSENELWVEKNQSDKFFEDGFKQTSKSGLVL